jgi:hypothetical protein
MQQSYYFVQSNMVSFKTKRTLQQFPSQIVSEQLRTRRWKIQLSLSNVERQEIPLAKAEIKKFAPQSEAQHTPFSPFPSPIIRRPHFKLFAPALCVCKAGCVWKLYSFIHNAQRHSQICALARYFLDKQRTATAAAADAVKEIHLQREREAATRTKRSFVAD